VLAQFHPEPRLDARVQTAHMDNPFFGKPAGVAPSEISFGSFRLLPTQFLLLEGDKPVSLGSRALEILIVLLERPGELVTKEELMTRVWPNVFVEPANLTVHMSALRRTLRDGRDGNRFIINIPGRGYSFVTSVEVSRQDSSARTAPLWKRRYVRRGMTNLRSDRFEDRRSPCTSRKLSDVCGHSYPRRHVNAADLRAGRRDQNQSLGAPKVPDYSWGNTEMFIYRGCMTEHREQE
jgi:DNA-binding winged helix-turn-helix (wHTH) protein